MRSNIIVASWAGTDHNNYDLKMLNARCFDSYTLYKTTALHDLPISRKQLQECYYSNCIVQMYTRYLRSYKFNTTKQAAS